MSNARRFLAAAGLGLVALAPGGTRAAADSYGPPAPRAPATRVTAPLAGSVTSAGTSYAVLEMGKTSGTFNEFWELFAERAGSSALQLVTPPGVADNGGLFLAPTPRAATVLVGFGASQGLTFSPLALSRDAGAQWSPGGLPAALVAEPSALTADGAGGALALTGSAGRVLERAGSLTSWRLLTDKAELGATPAGRTCALGGLSAVALAPSGSALVGASCRDPGTVGVFVSSARRWSLAAIAVPIGLAGSVMTVLRLDDKATAASTARALVEASGARSTSLLATWQGAPGRAWAVSSPLVLARSSRVVASGAGPGTLEFVVLDHRGTRTGWTIAGPGAPWRRLATLPAGTATLLIGNGGLPQALTASGKRLGVFSLDHGGRSWQETQQLDVPIVYGSSS